MVECIHHVIDKAFQVAGCRIAFHCHRSEGIDGRLNQHVGDGENSALQARRQAYTNDRHKLVRINPQIAKHQAAGVLPFHQRPNHQGGGDHLRCRRGNGNTGHAQAESNNRQQIKQHVHDAGDHKKDKRTFGIADGPQDGRTEIVHHTGRHTEKIDFHIRGRQRNDVVRGSHPRKKRAAPEKSDQQNDHAGDHAGQHGRMHDLTNRFFIFSAPGVSNAHADTHRQAHKHVDNQIDESAGGSHRRQSLAAGIPSDNDHIGGVEAKL